MTALSMRQNLIAVPQGSLEAYIQAVRSIPMLSAEEERALAERYHRDSDLDAARQLVLAHLRFVAHIARGYMGYGLPQADLIQEGNIGLMKAVKRFDPAMGVRLISFAVHWIRSEIHEFVLRNWRIVKIATTKAQRKLFFNLRSAKQRLGWFNKAEVEAVAKELNVSSAEVLAMEERLNAQDVAFETPVAHDEEETYAPVNFLEDQRYSPEAQLEQQDWQQHTEDRLHQALQVLDERSREILYRRWMAEEKATLQQLAEDYQVSAERVRQLEQNAFKKLRQAMAV